MITFTILLVLTLLILTVLALIAGAIGLVFGDIFVCILILYVLYRLVTHKRREES